jgi:hypothetical protein
VAHLLSFFFLFTETIISTSCTFLGNKVVLDRDAHASCVGSSQQCLDCNISLGLTYIVSASRIHPSTNLHKKIPQGLILAQHLSQGLPETNGHAVSAATFCLPPLPSSWPRELQWYKRCVTATYTSFYIAYELKFQCSMSPN